MSNAQIGKITLFKIVYPSLVVLFFVPLLINWILGFLDLDSRQLYSEYKNLYSMLVHGEGWFIALLVVQNIALILSILRYGPIAASRILENNKGLFFTGFKTVLSLWKWMLASVVLTLSVLQFAVFYTGNFVNAFSSLLFVSVFYTAIPYIFIALTHGLFIGYLIGWNIKRAARDNFKN